MILHRLSFRGLTRFTGEQPVTIDFEALGDGLVAIAGENGAGKTTILEAVFASLYRRFPSRPGSLYDHCRGRDAFIETTWHDTGREIRSQLKIDAERRTMEAYLFIDGEPTAANGSTKVFDERIPDLFGTADLFLASVFAAQNKAGSFLDKKKGERKALFVEMLGLGYLDTLAGKARDNATTCQRDLDTKRAVIAAGEREIAELPELRERLADAEHNASVCQTTLENAKKTEREAADALQRARSSQERIAPLERARRSAQEARRAAAQALESANRDRDRIRKDAAEKRTALLAQKPGEREERAKQRRDRALKTLEERRTALERQIANAPDLEAQEKRLTEIAAEKADIAGLEEARRKKGDLLVSARADLDRVKERYDSAVRQRELEVDRLSRQARLRGEVPCTVSEYWTPGDPGIPDADLMTSQPDRPLASECPLLKDANEAADRLSEVQARTYDDEQEAVRKAASDVAELEGKLHSDSEAHLIRTNRFRLIEAEEARVRDRIAAAKAAGPAREQLAGMDAERLGIDAAWNTEREQARSDIERMKRQIARIDDAESKDLIDSEKRISDASQADHDAASALTKADSELRSAQADLQDVGEAERLHNAAATATANRSRELRDAEAALTTIRTQVDTLQRKSDALDAERAGLAEVEQSLGDWRLLAEALGKDGIQALEVDAAGPEVAQTTNALLEATYGTRFSLVFETLREKRTAAGEYSEVFDVRVYDGGQERPVEALSGGEKVVIGEALGLAVSIFNARKSGVRYRTIWRDETAGALDPENAGRYVEMLRRALELGGFRQVQYVAHLPQVVESADAILRVEDGKVKATAISEAA